MVPWAHPSLHHKQHLDRFNRFSTVHDYVTYKPRSRNIGSNGLHVCTQCAQYGLATQMHTASSQKTDKLMKRCSTATCRITWKTLHTSQPLYLYELISHYLPPRSLRSSNTNLLTRPAGITSNFSSRAFSVSAPSTWNSLPAHIRSIDSLSTFKRHLKFHPSQSAFTV